MVESWLGPFWLGSLDGLGGVLGLFVAGLVLAVLLPAGLPPQALFENLAQVGATIFVAYAVATAGVAYRKDEIELAFLPYASFSWRRQAEAESPGE